jgi:hypothetical protein
LGSFDFAKHIPKRIGDFHEIKFRDQGFFVGFFFFFENLKILGIKTLGFFDFAKHIPKRMDGFHEIKI